jgi:hypothetical protein
VWTSFLAVSKERRAYVSVCPLIREWQSWLGRVVLVGTGEFFEAKDHVLQGLHVRYLA